MGSLNRPALELCPTSWGQFMAGPYPDLDLCLNPRLELRRRAGACSLDRFTVGFLEGSLDVAILACCLDVSRPES